VPDKDPARVLHVQFDLAEAKQFCWLLNRAVATLQPEKWPPITEELIQQVEKFVED
jgi:hypothetical protein